MSGNDSADAYESIAHQYAQSDIVDQFTAIEFPTLYRILGDLTDLSILDLGCGDGLHCRWLKKNGAARVLGVDFSEAMIAKAQQNEKDEPLGSRYLVHDAMTLDLNESPFDAVVAMWSIDHAKNYQELETFCRVAYRHLAPGGQFVGMTENPEMRAELLGSAYRRYGFVGHVESETLRDGDPIRWEYLNSDGTKNFDLVVQYFTAETYVKAFASAGFVEFKWEGLQMASDDATEHGTFLANFLDNKQAIAFSARKPAE